ncbi:MAG: ATP-dependent acyl-CoA ligase [Phenylobacterium sp.]|nr:ATP-dependent acyl-CoA ligase [Phenylobacterium sp.]
MNALRPPVAAEFPQDTITAALARAVAEVPDQPFIDFSGETYTFAEVDRMATELAHGLKGLGVETGQPVATIFDNDIEAVTVWLAINKLGAISAPVNTAFKGEFLKNQIEDCQARVVLAEGEYVDRVAAIAEALPDLRHVVFKDAAPPGLPGGVTATPIESIRVKDGGPIADEVTPEQLAIIVYTSGTTGRSKGCMLPHNMVCNMGWTSVRRGVGPGDVLWSPLPLFHLNAIGVSVVTALIARCRTSIGRRFSVSQFWPEIERSGATTVSLLGSMASLIAEAPDTPEMKRCYGQIRRVNAAPFPPPVVQKWRDRFGAPVQGSSSYGMTEAATISGLGPGEPAGPPGSSGRVGKDFETQIVDDGDNPLPPGTPGEIVVRPKRPNIMFAGYWNRPEETVKAWRNLWFHTGDLGKLDADGYLYFVDRKKDYIRRRGENISTHEMEAVFRQHPAIQDVAVHAVLSPLGEDEVKVTAEINPGAAVTEEELCRWSIERVPYFAVPLFVEFRESLPRSATGKVLKEQLRAEGRTPATWDRETAGVTFTRR